MGLEFIDGFGLYPTGVGFGSMVGNPWSGQGGFGTPTVVTTSPRTGTRCMQYNSNTTTGITGLVRPIAPSNRFAFGAALFPTSFSSNPSTAQEGIGITSSNNSNNTLHFRRVSGTQRLSLFRGANSSAIVEIPYDFSVNNWAYLYADFDFDTDEAFIRIGRGDPVIVPIPSIPLPTHLLIGGATFTPSNVQRYDDIFAWSDPGDALRDEFRAWADFRAFISQPAANAAPQDWTVTGAASAFEALNNIPPDAAEYIEAANVGDVSAFDLANVSSPLIERVYAAQHYFYGYNSAIGVGDVTASLNGGAGGSKAFQTSKSYYTDEYEINPVTGNPWLPADMANANSEYERTA